MEVISYYVVAFAVAALFFRLCMNLVGAGTPRRRLPPSGPLALPVIGHLYLLKRPLHQALARVSARYGPILLLRFGSRPVLLVSSPELAEECFTANDIVFANRPPLLFIKHFGFNSTGMGAAPYGAHWRNIRRISVLEIFSSSRINALSHIRAMELRSFLRRLHRESPTTVNLKSSLSELAFNTTMQMVAGKSYFGDDATAGAEEARRFVKIVGDFFRVSVSSSLEDFLPLLRRITKLELQMKNIAKEMDVLFQEMIEERRWRRNTEQPAGDGAGEMSEERKTIVDVMLELQHAEPDLYTDEIIRGMIFNLLTAGTETSSTSIEWAMALLLNNPKVMKKAIHEIDSQVGHNRLLMDSDLPKLSYLYNILRETMRLFPPGPFLVPHYSSDDCTIGGYDIPQYMMLLVNVYAIHRDPKVWDNPTEFKPERFEGLEAYGGRYVPFGMGRRKCPGENLGYRMMALTLGSLIQCFEWERIRGKEVDMTEGGGLSMPKAKSLEAICKPRQVMIQSLSEL